MALFQFKWLRKLVRRNTNPIPVYKAATLKERFSLAYMLLAWNAFGMVCYMCYTGRSDWAKYHGLKSEDEANMTPAKSYARLLGVEKSTIIQMSGFRKVSEFEYDTSENGTDAQDFKAKDNTAN